MSYYYSSQDIEDMYSAGILHRPGNSTQYERDLIQRNTKCPKCNGSVTVSQNEKIQCNECKYIFKDFD